MQEVCARWERPVRRKWCSTGEAVMEVDDRREEPYDSFKIISRKALEDYHKAEQKFLDFLQEADVWSKDQVRHFPFATRETLGSRRLLILASIFFNITTFQCHVFGWSCWVSS